jgi:hypothetical protein
MHVTTAMLKEGGKECTGFAHRFAVSQASTLPASGFLARMAAWGHTSKQQ